HVQLVRAFQVPAGGRVDRVGGRRDYAGGVERAAGSGAGPGGGSVVRPACGLFGRRVFGPAAMVTLLAGIGMAALMRWGMTLWLAWGLVGVFGSIALGGIAGRRAGMALAKLSAARDPDPAELQRARRRVL